MSSLPTIPWNKEEQEITVWFIALTPDEQREVIRGTINILTELQTLLLESLPADQDAEIYKPNFIGELMGNLIGVFQMAIYGVLGKSAQRLLSQPGVDATPESKPS